MVKCASVTTAMCGIGEIFAIHLKASYIFIEDTAHIGIVAALIQAADIIVAEYAIQYLCIFTTRSQTHTVIIQIEAAICNLNHFVKIAVAVGRHFFAVKSISVKADKFNVFDIDAYGSRNF